MTREDAGIPSRLPDDFAERLQKRLNDADGERVRIAGTQKWRWMGVVVVPLVAALCWAVLPWTFGIGVRALVSFAFYVTILLAVANDIDQGFLSYLGLQVIPSVIDGLLFLGVVSWLVWASRSGNDRRTQASNP